MARLAFSALTLLFGRQEGHPACKKLSGWGAGVVVCLKRGADLHIAQLMPLPLTVSLVHGAVSLMISFSKQGPPFLIMCAKYVAVSLFDQLYSTAVLVAAI